MRNGLLRSLVMKVHHLVLPETPSARLRCLVATTAFLAAGASMPSAQQPVATPPTSSSASGSYSLTPVTDRTQLKTPDGRIVFAYLTRKPAGVNLTSPSVACFHPINTPAGERVTALAPDDHPHHRGMYIAWHDAEFRAPIN